MTPLRAAATTAQPDVPTALSGLPEPRAAGLRQLGEAIQARVEHVLALTVARATTGDRALDAVVQDSFARICTNSTIAVARWLVGGDAGAAREAGKETWLIFGELAARRLTSLNEVARHCLCWRNSMDEVLRDSAADGGERAAALPQALSILQLSLEFSIVCVCECFEAERERSDQELKRREEELGFLATHDVLTGLPNRSLIIDRIEQMLARSRRAHNPVAALFIDLDGFKDINDTHGHAIGDQLLQAVSRRLDRVIRSADALGRLGGDEFVVISDDQSIAAAPELIAERLLATLQHPLHLGSNKETRVIVTASIGIATGQRTTADQLLRDADIAMYRAKRDGKNCYAVFEHGMEDSVEKRKALEID